MRNFFQPTATNMQDDFEADSSERPDPELLAEDDLGGMMEASKTEVDEMKEMDLMISHAENDKNVTYCCQGSQNSPRE